MDFASPLNTRLIPSETVSCLTQDNVLKHERRLPMSNDIATLDQILGKAAKLHRVLREAGLPETALQMPIDDPEMRNRLVRYWLSGGYEATTTQKLAREIMGKNYLGIEEAVTHFGVKPKRGELSTLAEILFTEAILRECKDTHILVAVFPLSINETRKQYSSSFYNTNWFVKESFAKERGEVGWHLIRKSEVPNSTSKTWQEQQALLGNNEETPSARVMVYTIVGHYRNTGEKLFGNICVRCSDLVLNGYRVFVGYFDAYGLIVSVYWDDDRGSVIGVSTSRKFD